MKASSPPPLVFGDDFDAPPFDAHPDDAPDPAAAAPPEPPRPEPLHTRAEMDDARADGFREGRARALAEDREARRRSALEDVAETLRAARAQAESAAEQAAGELARLLLAAMAAMMPEFCRAHGDAEARAVMRLILPGLLREPGAVIRASERTLAALAEELGGLDADAAARLVLTASGTMVDGDLRVAWRHGSAVRDAAAIWREIEAALALHNLSPAPAARAPAAAAASASQAAKETVDA